MASCASVEHAGTGELRGIAGWGSVEEAGVVERGDGMA